MRIYLDLGQDYGKIKPQVWNSVGNNWDEVFKHLKVNVKTDVHIRNSAVLSKSFEEGD